MGIGIASRVPEIGTRSGTSATHSCSCSIGAIKTSHIGNIIDSCRKQGRLGNGSGSAGGTVVIIGNGNSINALYQAGCNSIGLCGRSPAIGVRRSPSACRCSKTSCQSETGYLLGNGTTYSYYGRLGNSYCGCCRTTIMVGYSYRICSDSQARSSSLGLC